MTRAAVRVAVRRTTLALVVGLAAACGRHDVATPADTTRLVTVPHATEAIAATDTLAQAHGAEIGALTVSNAQPTAGNGVVRITRRAPLALPGASAAYTLEGVSGPLQHGFLVVFDSAGAVKIVTHKWANADNSVIAQTDCGSREKCPSAQVTADPKSGAVTFSHLVLTGLDGNTGDAATSTLSGRVP